MLWLFLKNKIDNFSSSSSMYILLNNSHFYGFFDGLPWIPLNFCVLLWYDAGFTQIKG